MLDRAVCAGARSGQLARGGADHAAFVCRSALRAVDAGGLPRLEGARGRRGRGALHPHRRRFVFAAGRRLRGPSRRQPRRNWTCRTGAGRAGPGTSAIPPLRCPDLTTSSSSPTPACCGPREPSRLQVELARLHGGDQTRVIENSPVRRIDLEQRAAGRRHRIGADRRRPPDRRRPAPGSSGSCRRLPVPLRVTRQQVLYFRPDDSAPFRIGRFPVFIFKGAGHDDAFYGMPEFQGLGVKVARHGGPEFDPDIDDRTIGEEYQDDRPPLPARPHSRPGRCADRFHRGLSLHRRARRSVSGRFPSGPDGRHRRQSVQRAWLQILMPDRPRPGRPGHGGQNGDAINAWRINMTPP